MEIKRLREGLPLRPIAPPVVALGHFDGFHRGHAAVLAAAARLARERGLPLLVFTFAANDAPKTGALLSDDDDRAAHFAAAGADYAVFSPFSEISHLTPQAFVREVLVGELRAAAAVTGEDFRFGAGAAGDAALLASLLREVGAEAVSVPWVTADGEKISSSRIRRALDAGDCRTAAELLGRPYALSHTVLHGRHIGHTLGFPTVNGRPEPDRALPAAGVYGTAVTLPDGRRYRAVTNVGTRPTVGDGELRVETHILDFSGDLYGERITVAFLVRLRGEREFSSLSALAEQIAKDCKEIQLWNTPNGHN